MIEAKKSLGQNFLTDTRVIERIIKVVRPKEGGDILEIGPGEGVLTEKLLNAGARVIAIELDDRLIEVLNIRFASFVANDQFRLVHKDILRTNIPELLAGYGVVGGGYRVVGNLPYYITSAVIRSMLELPQKPSAMYYMVQDEVADRIVAEPGEMSKLSVAVQFYGEPKKLFKVSKESFRPVPKVDSAFIEILSKGDLPLADTEVSYFFRLLRAGFCARRKTLLNNLSNSFHFPKDVMVGIIEKSNLSPHIRAQDLCVDDWVRLNNTLLSLK